MGYLKWRNFRAEDGKSVYVVMGRRIPQVDRATGEAQAADVKSVYVYMERGITEGDWEDGESV